MVIMEHFNTIIQLIAGVNFVFILSNFLEKTVDSLFGIKEHLSRGKSRYANKWLLDEETANTLEISTQDGRSNRNDLQELSKQYNVIAQLWNIGCDWLENVNNKAKSRLGFQTLFLLGSIFSISDLFLIAYLGAYPDKLDFIYVFSALISALYFVIEVILTIRILSGSISNIKGENLKFALWFLVLVILFFILTCILGKYSLTSFIVKYKIYVEYLALGLPFLPCIIGVLYIFVIEMLNRIVLSVLSAICYIRAIKLDRRKKKYMDMVDMCSNVQEIHYDIPK